MMTNVLKALLHRQKTWTDSQAPVFNQDFTQVIMLWGSWGSLGVEAQREALFCCSESPRSKQYAEKKDMQTFAGWAVYHLLVLPQRLFPVTAQCPHGHPVPSPLPSTHLQRAASCATSLLKPPFAPTGLTRRSQLQPKRPPRPWHYLLTCLLCCHPLPSSDLGTFFLFTCLFLYWGVFFRSLVHSPNAFIRLTLARLKPRTWNSGCISKQSWQAPRWNLIEPSTGASQSAHKQAPGTEVQ